MRSITSRAFCRSSASRAKAQTGLAVGDDMERPVQQRGDRGGQLAQHGQWRGVRECRLRLVQGVFGLLLGSVYVPNHCRS